jgi:Mg2+ and Co2+ transporter CorA
MAHRAVEETSRVRQQGRRVLERSRNPSVGLRLLLDATLGFINIQQDDLFKILTIVSAVGVPPTILVGIWA